VLPTFLPTLEPVLPRLLENLYDEWFVDKVAVVAWERRKSWKRLYHPSSRDPCEIMEMFRREANL
jgi:hypothetical protein